MPPPVNLSQDTTAQSFSVRDYLPSTKTVTITGIALAGIGFVTHKLYTASRTIANFFPQVSEGFTGTCAILIPSIAMQILCSTDKVQTIISKVLSNLPKSLQQFSFILVRTFLNLIGGNIALYVLSQLGLLTAGTYAVFYFLNNLLFTVGIITAFVTLHIHLIKARAE